MLRRGSLMAAVVCVVLLAGGCHGDPDPVKSTALFANEAEAFAAAEKTYRAYIDAENRERVDLKSSPAPSDFLTGSALEDEISARQLFEEQGIVLSGETVVDRVEGTSYDTTSVTALVCVDSSATKVLDSSGKDVTPTKRETRSTLKVRFVLVDDHLMIAQSDSGKDSIC